MDELGRKCIGIILNSNDPETIWNAFRLGNLSLEKGHRSKVFLLGKGVECIPMLENGSVGKFDVGEKARTFLAKGGEILSCTTCIKLREMKESKVCPLSSMKDLLEMIEKCDKVVTF